MGKPGKKPRPQIAAALDNDGVLDGTSVNDSVQDKLASASGALSPQTCCSNCQTVFEVSLEQLSSTDTRVRCGECLSIFDALANLRDSSDMDDTDLLIDSDGNVIELDRPNNSSDSAADSTESQDTPSTPHLSDASAASLAGLSNDTSSLDVTYSDFDLFSADAGLPEVAYFDQTTENTHLDFDGVSEDVNDETFSDTLFAQDVTVDARSTLRESDDTIDLHNISLDSDVDFVTNDTPREALVFNYRERETRTPGQILRSDKEYPDKLPIESYETELTESEFNDSAIAADLDTAIKFPDRLPRFWLTRSILFFLVVSLAGGLYMYREWKTLRHNSFFSPVVEVGCRMLGCKVKHAADLESLRVLNRTVFSHPSIDNALIIRVAFINEAAFSQPYPVMEIRLTDLNGKLVVKNNFQPIDYLSTWHEGDVLDAGKRLDISLVVEDPGQSAASFELDFR